MAQAADGIAKLHISADGAVKLHFNVAADAAGALLAVQSVVLQLKSSSRCHSRRKQQTQSFAGLPDAFASAVAGAQQ